MTWASLILIWFYPIAVSHRPSQYISISYNTNDAQIDLQLQCWFDHYWLIFMGQHNGMPGGSLTLFLWGKSQFLATGIYRTNHRTVLN